MAKDITKIVQLSHPFSGRALALVQEPLLLLLKGSSTVYDLAADALLKEELLSGKITSLQVTGSLPYDDVYAGQSDWKMLPAFDHPRNPFACLVSGTGLTHNSSALNRQAMHQAEAGALTDSMKMYQWGVEGGRPGKGAIGIQPEWFFKGTGHILRGHNQALDVPPYAGDGGEEPEVAGIYLIDQNGSPRRIGFAIGNEFSDHVMEKKNYLYLAPSKLRTCSIGPELVIDLDFSPVIDGKVSITRDDKIIWSKDVRTGEAHMAHSVANLEHHHFKYEAHRVPGQAHVHFFGADGFSFGDNITLQHGDIMEVAWEGFGRPLKNFLNVQHGPDMITNVTVM